MPDNPNPDADPPKTGPNVDAGLEPGDVTTDPDELARRANPAGKVGVENAHIVEQAELADADADPEPPKKRAAK